MHLNAFLKNVLQVYFYFSRGKCEFPRPHLISKVMIVYFPAMSNY